MIAYLLIINCISLSDENTSEKSFLTGGHDEVILLWQWNQTTNCVDCTCACRGHAGSVDSIAVDPTKTKVN